ncbi:MAG: adenylate/guanylate cyclase domain-containing protein [Verrucomicrobiota bacterium]
MSCLHLPDGQMFGLQGSCTLGRGPENTVPIANDHVSRKHAIIQLQGRAEFWLVDLGSANGTYVNERRVSRPLALKDGDVIDMAGSRIVFHSEEPSADGGHDVSSMGSTILSVVRKNCWLMVADIVGSTRLAQELPPEEVPLLTGGWFKTCRDLIEEHGGHMNKYLGDGFFCYWEDSVDSRSRILQAMRGLAQLQAEASPPFRVVLHRGMTVLGSVPTVSALDLHGPAVNFVFRMEKLAAGWGEIRLFSEAAMESFVISSLAGHESEVEGYDGRFKFFVPDLGD